MQPASVRALGPCVLRRAVIVALSICGAMPASAEFNASFHWETLNGGLKVDTSASESGTLSGIGDGDQTRSFGTNAMRIRAISQNLRDGATPGSSLVPRMRSGVGLEYALTAEAENGITTWGVAQARVKATSRLSDQLTVVSLAGGPTHLEFTWQIDGWMNTHVSSVGIGGAVGVGTVQHVEFGMQLAQPTGVGSMLSPVFSTESVHLEDHARLPELIAGDSSPTLEESVQGNFGRFGFPLDLRFGVDTPPTPYTVTVPFVPGTALDVEFYLSTLINTSLYNIDYAGILTSVQDNNFLNTAKLTGFRVLDGAGRALAADQFSLTSAGGFSYPVNGVSAVPEPPAWALIVIGAGMLAVRRREARAAA